MYTADRNLRGTIYFVCLTISLKIRIYIAGAVYRSVVFSGASHKGNSEINCMYSSSNSDCLVQRLSIKDQAEIMQYHVFK